MSRRERNKGARGELEIVEILRSAGWPKARRNFASGARGGSDVTGVPGVAIEVKFQERLSVPAALRQLEADADPLDVPVLMHRSSRQQWLATLPLDELLPLLALKEAA